MVDTHNTVDVTVEWQVHMGGWVGFFRKDGCRYLQNTIGVWGALPHVPGVVNHGALHRCPEARGGPFLPYESSNGAYNTVDVIVECQVHMGGCVGFFRKGGRQYL